MLYKPSVFFGSGHDGMAREHDVAQHRWAHTMSHRAGPLLDHSDDPRVQGSRSVRALPRPLSLCLRDACCMVSLQFGGWPPHFLVLSGRSRMEHEVPPDSIVRLDAALVG